MPVLVIETQELADLKRIKKYAESMPFSLERMKKRVAGEEPIPGEDEQFSCTLPVGFKVVFTIERHPKFWARHMSMSFSGPGKIPDEHGIQMVMEELGFQRAFKDLASEGFVWLENELIPNIIEPIEEKA